MKKTGKKTWMHRGHVVTQVSHPPWGAYKIDGAKLVIDRMGGQLRDVARAINIACGYAKPEPKPKPLIDVIRDACTGLSRRELQQLRADLADMVNARCEGGES